MSEATTLDPVQQAPEEEAPDTEAQDEAQEEKTLNPLLRKAESAFAKGGKALLTSRVECGKHCHAVYAYRLEHGHKDRSFTSKLIFNRLSVHADSARECDASLLAKLFKTVDLLADKPWDKKHEQPWHALTLGMLEDSFKLIDRADGTELYGVFDKAKAEQAKALFAWACGDGLKRPSRDDINNRLLELMDPAKYAERQAKAQAKAEEAKDGTAEAPDTGEEPDAPENLIPTNTAPDATRSMPDWKDIGEKQMGAVSADCRAQHRDIVRFIGPDANLSTWHVNFATLHQMGLIESTRGRDGGFWLTARAAKVTAV
jgi:hypothetical protein